MNFKNFLFFLVLFVTITYGVFYHNYKFLQPNFGSDDYYNYKEMVQNPWNSESTKAPFVYRQFTTYLASLILDSGLYYPSNIAYECSEEEQRVFFSLLASNYLGILACLMTITFFLVKCLKFKRLSEVLLPVFLMLTSFHFLFTGMSVLTEGWTYFFNALLFLFFYQKKILWFTALVFISLVQKEVSSMYFVIIGFLFLALEFWETKKIDKNYLIFTVVSAAAFMGYLVIRKLLIPISGFQGQTSVTSWFDAALRFKFSGEFLRQTVFSLGVFFIFMWISLKNQNLKQLFMRKDIKVMFVSVVCLFLIGILTGIGNNAGRIVFSFMPIFLMIMAPHFNTELEDTRS